MAVLRITDFTDPGCPFAFSAEPARLRLLWLYGDQIDWRPRMIVLARSPEEYLDKGFTPELQEQALADIQARYRMPIDPGRRPRMAATAPACRAVVAARLHWPEHEHALLRRLRIRAMAGELLDSPFTIASAAREAGIDAMPLLHMWTDDPAVERALEADAAASRRPSEAALAMNHKLAPAGDGRRYTAPSYEIARLDGRGRFEAPGFQPAAVYEAAVANLAPELERRAAPASVDEVLAWAGEPLATAEVAAICEIEHDEARTELEQVAGEAAVGPESWWTLAGEHATIAA